MSRSVCRQLHTVVNSARDGGPPYQKSSSIGWRVLERLKNDLYTRHIPIYIVSTEEARERSLDLGALGFVPKPIKTKEVLEAMSVAEDGEHKRRERAQQIGLFRYMLIRDAADGSLSPRQRGAKVRELAGREHTDPFGRPVRVSRWTLDYWIREWRRGGFEALVPSVRQAQPRTPEEVLALARALLRPAPILLLDEPTANLDPLTERAVLQTIHGLTADRGRTTLMITHRLVGLEHFDEVIVLEHGRIVERGTHAGLFGRGGLYRRLWDLQNRVLLS